MGFNITYVILIDCICILSYATFDVQDLKGKWMPNTFVMKRKKYIL